MTGEGRLGIVTDHIERELHSKPDIGSFDAGTPQGRDRRHDRLPMSGDRQDEDRRTGKGHDAELIVRAPVDEIHQKLRRDPRLGLRVAQDFIIAEREIHAEAAVHENHHMGTGRDKPHIFRDPVRLGRARSRRPRWKSQRAALIRKPISEDRASRGRPSSEGNGALRKAETKNGSGAQQQQPQKPRACGHVVHDAALSAAAS